MGRAIRYVPYPVVGGFLGATGLLIVLGAIRVITGIPCNSHTLDAIHEYRHAVRTGRGLRHGAGAVSDLAPLARSPFGLPVILIGGVIAAQSRSGSWASRRTSASRQAGPFSLRRPSPSCCHGARRTRPLSLVCVAGTERRCDRGDVCDSVKHPVQHHGHRGGGAPRDQSRARTQSHRPCQHAVRRIRRVMPAAFQSAAPCSTSTAAGAGRSPA